MIYNSETCPKFFFDKSLDVRFFPKNEVYASFEIKSTLNDKELSDAIEKIQSVKEISSYRSKWLRGDKEWDEYDAKIAENEDLEDMWGRTRKTHIKNEDFKEYKLKIKKQVVKYSNTFCGIFAYKSGKKQTLDLLRQTLIKKENPPDIVVILNQGLLVKVDDFTIKRLKSLSENKAQYHYDNDFDIFHQKWQLLGFDKRTEYLILNNSNENVNLMYYYIFLIDFLNEFHKCPDSYASDIISVWKKE